MEKLKDKHIKVEGLSLPKSIQIGIDNRNLNGENHIFDKGVIKVLCSKCKEYHSVYHLENGQWIDINKSYRLSVTRNTKDEYFGTKCTKCYQNRESKRENEAKTVEIIPLKEEKPKNKEKYRSYSKKNGGIQQTIFLLPDLDRYLKLYEALNGTRKNELINQVLISFKEKNPIKS